MADHGLKHSALSRIKHPQYVTDTLLDCDRMTQDVTELEYKDKNDQNIMGSYVSGCREHSVNVASTRFSAPA